MGNSSVFCTGKKIAVSLSIFLVLYHHCASGYTPEAIHPSDGRSISSQEAAGDVSMYNDISQEPNEICPIAFNNIGDRCYFYGRFKLNWFRAMEFCHSFGSSVSLACIETAEENQNLKRWLLVHGDHSTGVWVGGSDNGHIGRWAWFPTGQLIRHFNWGPSQPTGRDQHCMYIVGGYLGYQWADFHCGFEMTFLCEYNVNDHEAWRRRRQMKNSEASQRSEDADEEYNNMVLSELQNRIEEAISKSVRDRLNSRKEDFGEEFSGSPDPGDPDMAHFRDDLKAKFEVDSMLHQQAGGAFNESGDSANGTDGEAIFLDEEFAVQSQKSVHVRTRRPDKNGVIISALYSLRRPFFMQNDDSLAEKMSSLAVNVINRSKSKPNSTITPYSLAQIPPTSSSVSEDAVTEGATTPSADFEPHLTTSTYKQLSDDVTKTATSIFEFLKKIINIS